MLKTVKRKFSPLIWQIYRFSSNTAIEHTKKINPKVLFGRNKSNQCSLITNCSFAGASVPMITNIDYEQMQKFISQNEVLVIDVRTREELAETGVLPNSYNIPLDELSNAFELAPNEFLGKYNAPKPDKDQIIVFSCAKGIRSLKACQLVANLGYQKVFNYTEGWFGWETHK